MSPLRLPAALLLAVLLDSGSPSTHLRYRRDVHSPRPGSNCLILDPSLYAHAAPTLADLRLRIGTPPHDLPFLLLQSGSLQADPDPARILHPQQLGRAIAFDLGMPPRPYTDVVLDLAAPSLLAHATVRAGSPTGPVLGDFSLFRLAADHLGSDTTLHLQETAAPLLHVTLTPLPGAAPLTPDLLRAATVPPSREAQTLFTPATATSIVTQLPGQTLARFTVPAHLPIERVRLTLAPASLPNFSRALTITSHAVGEPESAGETIRGTVNRVHLTRAGATLSLDQLTVPATLGANLQHPAEVQVAIENGTAAPLPLASVILETRQRQLCFVAPAPAEALTLLYGDPKLDPPPLDTQPIPPGTIPAVATLGPEQPNPLFTPRGETRPMTRRHPRLVALTLLLTLCLAAVVALRSGKLRL